jgi:hypothetical protein
LDKHNSPQASEKWPPSESSRLPLCRESGATRLFSFTAECHSRQASDRKADIEQLIVKLLFIAGLFPWISGRHIRYGFRHCASPGPNSSDGELVLISERSRRSHAFPHPKNLFRARLPNKAHTKGKRLVVIGELTRPQRIAELWVEHHHVLIFEKTMGRNLDTDWAPGQYQIRVDFPSISAYPYLES